MGLNFLPKILVINDDPCKCRLLTETLKSRGLSRCIHSASFDLAAAVRKRVRPDLILVDISGHPFKAVQTIACLRSKKPREDFLPILAVEVEDEDEARETVIEAGATDYVLKPLSPCELALRARNLLRARMLQLQVTVQREELEQRVEERTIQIQDAYEEALYMLAKAGEYRDDDTGSHAQRVGDLAREVAFHMDLPLDQVARIGQAALLHDLGKIGIPDAILLKPGKLSPEELETMKRHAEIGAEILANSRSEIFRLAEIIALTHHERWDGTGYLGMEGEAIPIVGRIVAVADVFDALVHARPYKPAWPTGQAIEEIKSLSGSAFDPKVVDAFLAVMAERQSIIDLELGIAS